MFLIEKLWIDPLENRTNTAMGFTKVCVVSTKEAADYICSLDRIERSKCPWPLNFADFQGCDAKSVPRFRSTEVDDLTGMDFEQIKHALKLDLLL